MGFKMKAYQRFLYETQVYATRRDCLLSKTHKVRNLKIVVHSGVYDGVSLAYCGLIWKVLKEDSHSLFNPVGSYHGLHFTLYSKNPKSLLALVRKHLKEEI